WQIPHFMAVAWTYRRDYAAVNFPMLPVLDTSGTKVARWSLINAILLVAVSLLPALTGWCSRVYLGVAAALGGVVVWGAGGCFCGRRRATSRRESCFTSRSFISRSCSARWWRTD